MPPPRFPKITELRALLRLALPISAIQVGMMLMGTVDALMVGRVSAEGLAAVTIGNLYVWGLIIFGNGVLLGLDPLVAQAVGANDPRAAAVSVQRGLVLALLMSIPASLLVLPCEAVFHLLGQPRDVIPSASAYVTVSSGGILPFLLFVLFRQALQAHSKTAPILLTILGANLLNVFANWVLIFGHLGLPALGVVGSAWATVVSRWFLAVGLAWIGWRHLRGYLRPWSKDALRAKPLLRTLRLGVPVGVQFELEMGAFAATAVLMGLLGKTALAAHQPAINLASLSFMVPVGIGAAAAVRVGVAVGRGDREGTRLASVMPLWLGGGVMLVFAMLFTFLPRQLATLFTPNQPEVIALTSLLIPIAGVFQVFDGLQVVAVGVLRGTGDTRTPMFVALAGFWMIGLPTSLLLGFGLGLGAVGLWWGLVAGHGSVAAILLTRVRRRLREEITRTLIDEPSPATP